MRPPRLRVRQQRASSHPDFDRRFRISTGSALPGLAGRKSSRTVTAGAGFHRPWSTCFVSPAYNSARTSFIPCRLLRSRLKGFVGL